MSVATNDQQYYEDKELWGEDMFTNLKDIINNILITADDDSYFKHSKRFRASIFGKQIIKSLNVDVQSKDKAISIQLSPSQIFPFPRYMTNWSRIGVMNKCDKLSVLNINNNPTTHDYLQDNEWKLLYDESGNVLRGADFDAQKGDCCLIVQCETVTTTECNDSEFKNSWVKENKEGNYFEFSEDLVDQIIVIEYQTAGLDTIDDCDIKVHHYLEDTVTRGIQWNLLMGKRNTPDKTVFYYEDLYKKAKKKSKNLLAKKITVEQMLKAIDLRTS
jgi:hypothetical protein